MPGARKQSKLPIDIGAGNRQTSSQVCTQTQTHAFRPGFNRAPMSARAVAEGIRNIFARLAFLYILSGQGQLHAREE
jgi:hypothetical protein